MNAFRKRTWTRVITVPDILLLPMYYVSGENKLCTRIGIELNTVLSLMKLILSHNKYNLNQSYLMSYILITFIS